MISHFQNHGGHVRHGFHQLASAFSCQAVQLQKIAAALRGTLPERFACPLRKEHSGQLRPQLDDAISVCEQLCLGKTAMRTGLSSREKLTALLSAKRQVHQLLTRQS